MASDSPRASAIVHALAHAGEPVTAAALAKAVSVSERTIKKEMSAVRSLASRSGARLVARRGRGYWLQVVDPSRFGEVLEQLDIKATFRGFTGAASQARTRALLSRLLLADGYLRSEELAEEMFISRSAMRPDLRAARFMLSGFGLELEHRPHSGIRIAGSEFGVRLCITSLFESAFHHAVPVLADGAAPIDPGETSGLRQDLLAVLRASQVRISDIRTQRLAQYLAVSAMRVRSGHRVELDPRRAEIVHGIAQLQVARQVLDAATARTGVPFNEEEATDLAALMLMWTDVEGRVEHIRRYGRLGVEAVHYADLIRHDLVNSFGVDVFGNHAAHTTLAAGLIPVLARRSAGFWSADMPIGHQAQLVSADSPMALAIARRAACLLAPGSLLSADGVSDLAGRVTVAIGAVQHDFTPRRIALCSGRGLDAAAHLRSEILDQYPADRYFAAMDTYELYELRGVDKDAYDAVVFDGALVTYRYDWPVVSLGRPIGLTGLARFREVVIQPGFGFERLLKNLGVGSIVTFRGVRARSRVALASVIGFRLGEDEKSAKEIEAQVLDALDTSIFGHVCAIIIPRLAHGHNQVESYELDVPLQDDDNEIRNVLVCALNFEGSSNSLRLFDELMSLIVGDPQALRQVMDSRSFASVLPTIASASR